MLDAHNPEIVEDLRGVGRDFRAHGCALIQRIARAAAADRLDDGLQAAFAVHVDNAVGIRAEHQRRVDVHALFRAVQRPGVLAVDRGSRGNRGGDGRAQRQRLCLGVAGGYRVFRRADLDLCAGDKIKRGCLVLMFVV